MPKNEDGEFELILGNRQLFGVFFIVALLFGVFFVMGYIVGQNSAPLARADTASSARKPEVKPVVVDAPGRAEPASEPAPETSAPPSGTAPQQPASAEPQTTRAAKPEPAPAPTPKPAKVQKLAPVSSQPVPGQSYLQLAAIDKDHADGMVDLLRSNGFKALDYEIPEMPGTYRVLVGPVGEGEANKLRADLQAKSFAGNAAIRKTF